MKNVSILIVVAIILIALSGWFSFQKGKQTCVLNAEEYNQKLNELATLNVQLQEELTKLNDVVEETELELGAWEKQALESRLELEKRPIKWRDKKTDQNCYFKLIPSNLARILDERSSSFFNN